MSEVQNRIDINAAKEAMVEVYGDYGYSAEDFDVVTTLENDKTLSRTLMLTAVEGIDLRESSMSKGLDKHDADTPKALFCDKSDERFKVPIDGEVYDSRNLGYNAYSIFVKGALARCVIEMVDPTIYTENKCHSWIPKRAIDALGENAVLGKERAKIDEDVRIGTGRIGRARVLTGGNGHDTIEEYRAVFEYYSVARGVHASSVRFRPAIIL